ncbi:MAG: hypothetical protein VCD50_06395 [Alphaproteobacteria bacterium]|jgi:hypothetical protein
MSRISKILTLLIFIAVAGGAVFLMTWDIPAPTARVEITVPDDTFKN